MSFLTRPAAFLRPAALRPARSIAPRVHTQIRFGTSDYGSGVGNPAGEKPEQQGKNLSEGLEHPGPPPPKVAKGQSSSSPNNDDKSSGPSSQKSSGKSSVEPGQQSQSSDGTSKSGAKGAQPKILNESPPSEENQSGDVKQHNKDMANRTEQENKQASDDGKDNKVSKKFWAGKS